MTSPLPVRSVGASIAAASSLPRRAFLSLSCAALLALLAGCAQQETADKGASGTPAGGPDATTTASPGASASPGAGAATPVEGTLKVALVTPSKISDKGWGASAYAGTQKIKAELGAEVGQPIEEPPLAQVEKSLRDFAQDGYHVVFLHGSEYDDVAKRVAPDYPKTTFVVMGGRSAAANLTPIQFASGEATYLAGMLAGGMSKSGKVGCVGPNEIPIIKDSFGAFESGAKAVNPSVNVKVTWTGSDSDIAKGKQQAQALLSDGVDVILHNANAAGAGVFQAVMEKDGAMVIGANADQSDQATPKNLGSFILDVPSAMLAVAKQVKEGTSDGKPYSAGLKDKAVSFKFNPGFKGAVPPDLKAKMEKAEQDMMSGALKPKA